MEYHSLKQLYVDVIDSSEPDMKMIERVHDTLLTKIMQSRNTNNKDKNHKRYNE